MKRSLSTVLVTVCFLVSVAALAPAQAQPRAFACAGLATIRLPYEYDPWGAYITGRASCRALNGEPYTASFNGYYSAASSGTLRGGITCVRASVRAFNMNVALTRELDGATTTRQEYWELLSPLGLYGDVHPGPVPFTVAKLEPLRLGFPDGGGVMKSMSCTASATATFLSERVVWGFATSPPL